MIFNETALPGAFVIDLERREDSRGYFARAFCQHELADARAQRAGTTSTATDRSRPGWRRSARLPVR